MSWLFGQTGTAELFRINGIFWRGIRASVGGRLIPTLAETASWMTSNIKNKTDLISNLPLIADIINSVGPDVLKLHIDNHLESWNSTLISVADHALTSETIRVSLQEAIMHAIDILDDVNTSEILKKQWMKFMIWAMRLAMSCQVLTKVELLKEGET